MQGAFPVGADWSAALDPGNDALVERQVRSDLLEKELARIAQLRNPGVPPPAPNPLKTYVLGPFPRTTHFRLNGTQYYVLKDIWRTERARPGTLGHYLVTTVVDELPVAAGGTSPYSRPFLHPVVVTNQIPVVVGAPGTTPGDARAPPNQQYCLPGRDYTVANAHQTGAYWEIGLTTLTESLEAGEALDLAFARRLEGLGNVAAQVCWDCLDPDYDPSDRPLVRDQFLARYLAKFYDANEPNDFGPRAEDVADEAVDKHRALCQAWAKKHYRTLTPYVTAPAEALASDFYRYIDQPLPEESRLSRAELARLLMRHPETATEFARCLHNYSVGLEQARGGRNASYKQMSATSAARAASYKRMGDLLGEKMIALRNFLATLDDPHERRFHAYIVDWYAILGQMPQVHKYFDGSAGMYRPKRAANARANDHVPPWKFGKRDD